MNIELRCRSAETVTTYFRMTRDPEVRKYLPQKARSEEEALEEFAKQQQPAATSYGQTIYANGKHVGDIWCYCIQEDEPNAMISYCIFEKSIWGQGCATRALAMFLLEVKKLYRLNTVGAFVYSENEASLKVLRKNGFAILETFYDGGVESKYLQKECK